MSLRFLIAFAVLLSSPVARTEPQPRVDEYFLISIPGLSPFGSAYVSWFFLRSGVLWQNEQLTDLYELKWPQWDSQQIPVALVPAAKQSAFLVIFDQSGANLDEFELKSPFLPEEYERKSKVKPGSYQVKIVLSEGRAELRSPVFPWYSKRPIARCEADLEKSDAAAKRKLRLCFDTINAYLSDSGPAKRQIYVNVAWPKARDRETLAEAQGLERELRAKARKAGASYVSEKSAAGKKFSAQIGLTQRESLPQIGLAPGAFADAQAVQAAPDTKQPVATLHDFTATDGSRLVLRAFYSDRSEERDFTSPALGRHVIHLQLTPASATGQASAAELTQTRELERRTGVGGALRRWQLLASGGYNYLTSNRGESVGFWSLPRVDATYNTGVWELIPRFGIEKSLFRLGSKLEISELRAGVNRRLPWFDGIHASLGYLDYALSGTNPGSARLGSLSAVSAGLGAEQRFERWILRESVDVLFADTQSFALRLDAGEMRRWFGDEKFYLGAYFNYAHYRAGILNKIKIVETFTETRMQAGITAGWIGPESF